MPERPQSFKNHGRYVVGFHMVLFPILTVNLGWRVYRAWEAWSGENFVQLLLAAGLILLYYYARLFPLTVQDRVIRLEMRLRLARVLPPDVAAQAEALTLDQLIALRFAGDAELPGLVRKVIADRITSRTEIKKLVKDWEADYLRV